MAASPVSIRELQQHLRRVMARVERGETIEVTRRRRPVARLEPVHRQTAATGWPDLEARTRAIFGRRAIVPGGADLLLDHRGER